MNKKIIGIIFLLVVATGSYKMGQSSVSATASLDSASSGTTSSGSYSGGGRRAGSGGFGGMISGSVLSVDDTGITIKVKDTSSKIIFISPESTKIIKSVDGSKSDLVAGTNVSINGTTNTDGSVSASMIQIRQSGQGFGGQQGSTQN